MTEVFGINASGRLVGGYKDSSGHVHGFIATPNNGNISDVMKSPF